MSERAQLLRALISSRRELVAGVPLRTRKEDAEGGCGVIGMAASVPVPGRHLLPALAQMRNRGNGKGGGIAAVGLAPEAFGVSREVLEDDYLLAVAYLDETVREEVERSFVRPTFEVDHVLPLPAVADLRSIPGLEVKPPQVVCYFVRVRPHARGDFARIHGLPDGAPEVDDEIVFQNSFALNRACYASTGEKRAFVLSHGKNLLVLKLVGYGDNVIRYWQLENLTAHVWIGHHRYPTKGRVWHPGGAHPFIGMHEALVHNGDFANYASITSYLAQHNVAPLFLTDTEVAVLVFDLLQRGFGYPLEYVMEAMAPTTERDFTLLPPDKQEVYRMLQSVHMHGSPDGPWFFLVAQSDVARRAYRLIGITDTSMLRPQVFALQQGRASIGLAASEKQAIDAALESLAHDDERFWSHPDLTWNARGGSHTDGGAFVFTVRPEAGGRASLTCTDKFGRPVEADVTKAPPLGRQHVSLEGSGRFPRHPLFEGGLESGALEARVRELLPGWDYGKTAGFIAALAAAATGDEERRRALDVLTSLGDRRFPLGAMKRSRLRSLLDEGLAAVFERIRQTPSPGFRWSGWDASPPEEAGEGTTLVVDARGFPVEGDRSLARALVAAVERGYCRLIVAHARGHRFIGCALGPGSSGVHVDVYGSAGDYLGSGLDGARMFLHGSGQDQLAQIMKDGLLVVHGDVGQTFGYAAKGGHTFVLGNAAGRPLINAVGRPRVVINGTCLDYLAESFMAGDPLAGGGFVIVNGVTFDEDGGMRELPTPYPGGNLFSLASGGAIYLRDPHRRVMEDQLNGGELAVLLPEDAALIAPVLEENERLLGVRVADLLAVDGAPRPLEAVYRKVRPAGHKALLPEEAWVGARHDV